MRLIDADKALSMVKPYEASDEIWSVTGGTAIRLIHSAFNNAPTIDVRRMAVQLGYEQVVRCKDCEYSYDEISYLCCSHGVCVDCEVPPNFYCAEGKRKEPDE